MSAVVGCDFSTHAIDLVKLDETDNHATWTRIPLEGTTAWERTRHAAQQMPRGSYWDDVYLAAIESPKSAGFNTATKLHRVQGVVLANIPAGLHVWEVTPAEWKKQLGISVSVKPSPRDFPALLDIATCGFLDWPQDALDALGIALYARETNRKGIAA